MQKRSRAHMLLVVIVVTTIVSLMLAMAMEPVNTANQRLQERTLIYRGQHLAKGIQRFYAKFGRFPFRLEELIEQEPRFVRRLYKDPMSEDGAWTLVFLNPQDQGPIKALNQALARVLGQDSGEQNSENIEEGKPGQAGNPFNVQQQQITGLRSQSQVEGLKKRDDSSIYADWLFSALPQVGMDELLDLP